jgi:PAS domain S-box-containing protein
MTEQEQYIILLIGPVEDRAIWKQLLTGNRIRSFIMREAHDAATAIGLFKAGESVSCIISRPGLYPAVGIDDPGSFDIPLIMITRRSGDATLELISMGADDILYDDCLDEDVLVEAVMKALLRKTRGYGTSCVSVREDLTDLQKVTGELVRSEEKFRAIFQSIADGVALLDLIGGIIQVNRAFLDLQAVSDEDSLYNHAVTDFIYVDDRVLWESTLALTWEYDRSHVFEYRNITADNRIIEVEMEVSPFIRRDGTISGYVAVLEDITERKKTESEMQKSEGRNRALVEAVPDLMFRLDDRGMYIDDYLRDKIRKVFPDSIMPDIINVIGKAFATREIQVYEYPVYLRDEVRYYEARIIISGLSEVLVILRNVTDRKTVEDEMKKARDEAESANRAKSEFLANMSHEIRTPLHSILGFIEILKQTGMDVLQKEYLNIVSTSARSLLGIINDILDFSKIESRKLAIDSVAFDPKREFESVIDLFHVKAGEKKIELLPFIDPLLPGLVMGDPLRIKQVLSNLLSNAVKFTPERGIIIITVEKIGGDAGTCRILFSVADTGIGIPDYKKKQIFEAFQQLDTSITRKYGGTGLGLSISLNLVRLMGSDIDLESEAGEGSTFRFILNLEEAESPEMGGAILKVGAITARAAVFTNETTDSLQEELVMRYLQSLQCQVTVVLDFEEEYERDIDILFFVYSPKKREALRSVMMKKSGIPLVVAAHGDELPEVLDITGRDTHVITLPVNGSKLYNALVNVLHPELLKTVSLEPDGDEGPRSFSARVLVAEDNAVNRMLMKLMLGQYGIETVMATNGLEAFDLFRESRCDLILMDVNMPVSDGIETTEMILNYEREKNLKHTPIIALTAKAMKGDREYLLARGMDDYLPKPLEAAELRKMLSRYLEPVDSVTESSGTTGENEAGVRPGEPVNYDFRKVAGELGIPMPALKTLLENFIKNAGECIIALENSVERGDFEGMCGNAHRLKGTAANLRIEGLAALMLDMETSAGSEEERNYDDLLCDIKKEYERVTAFLRAKTR